MEDKQPKLDKLQQLLKLLNDGLTKDEFVKSFANVVDLVKKMQAQNASEVAAMHRSIELLSKKVANDATTDVAALTKQITEIATSLISKYDDKEKAIDAKVAGVRDGRDGEDGQDGINGKDGSPDTAEQVRDKIESLTGDDRIDISSIKGLEDYAETAQLARQSPRIAAGRAIPRVFPIDLSASLDGTTKTFALPTNFGILSVDSSSAPFGAFRPIIDYAQVGKNLVFTASVDAPSALAAGQSLVITILK